LDALRARAPRASLVQFGGSTGLARCTNFEKEETIAALVAIDHVDGEPVRVTTLGTSGTIRKATEKFLR
jgi:ribonuclease P/MRP protein subunit POP5